MSRPRPDSDDIARIEALRAELRRLRAEVMRLEEDKRVSSSDVTPSWRESWRRRGRRSRGGSRRRDSATWWLRWTAKNPDASSSSTVDGGHADPPWVAPPAHWAEPAFRKPGKLAASRPLRPVLRLPACEEIAAQPEELLRQARLDDVGVTSGIERPVNGKVGGMPRTRENRDVSRARVVLQTARRLPSVKRGQ